MASIAVTHSDRPLTPTQVSNDISELLEDLDGDYDELEKRLPIKKEMVKHFERLLKLPLEIQDIVVWGDSKKDTGEISFSSANQIAKIENPSDVLELVSAIHSVPRPVTKTEVKNIISLKNNNENKTMSDCIKEVLQVTRTEIIQSFIFISGIDSILVKKLLSENNLENINKHILNILSPKFPPNSLKNINLKEDHIRLSLSKDGRNFIHEYSRNEDIPLRDVVNHLLGVNQND